MLCLALLLLLVLSIGWGLMPRSSSGKDPLPAIETDRKVVVCYGYADLEGGITSLHPSQPGRVAEVLVKENDSVKANAILLRLDDRAARYRVEEARALLEKSQTQLTKAKKAPEQHLAKMAQQKAAIQVARARVAGAKHILAARKAQQKTDAIGRSRNDPILAEEIGSSAERVKEFEETETAERQKLRVLEAQDPRADVALAQAEAATMQARLRQAEQALEEHVLRAPVAGKVLRLFVTPGELVSLQPKQPVIQFSPDRPRIIRAEIEQVFSSRVTVGQETLVEDDGRSGHTWRGHVMRLADWYTQRRLVADEQLQLKDVRTLECLIMLEPGQPPLRIGQRVRVTISEGGQPDGRNIAEKSGDRKG
jgi:multidrug resistance efflux pump